MKKLKEKNNTADGFYRFILCALSIFLLISPIGSLAIDKNKQNNNDKATSVVIFQIFSDSGQTIPRPGQPFILYSNGEILDRGRTDRDGNVILTKRIPKTKQDILMDLYGFGIFYIEITPSNDEKIEKLADAEANNIQSYCSKVADSELCKDKYFLWLSLIGRDFRFNGEPYLLSGGLHDVEGIVDENGYIYIDNLPDTSKEFTLTLCSGPSIRITPPSRNKSDIFNPKAKIEKQKPLKRPQKCSRSKVAYYTKNNTNLNMGIPYIFSNWEDGISPPAVEIAMQKRETRKLADYRERARANNDDLAWLGNLPIEWSETDYENRQQKLIQTINMDVNRMALSDIKKFRCKKPESVGAIPDMQAVEDFLNAAATHQPYDDDQMDRLFAAAEKGNWLAIVQVYVYKNQTSGDLFDKSRTLQLAEWLLARKNGVVYRELGYALANTGYYGDSSPGPNPYDVFAAIHNSYPAQYKVGKELSRSADKALKKIGNDMMDCALNALPAYRKLLPSSN